MTKLTKLFNVSVSIMGILFFASAIGTGFFGEFRPPLSPLLNVTARAVMIFAGIIGLLVWCPEKKQK